MRTKYFFFLVLSCCWVAKVAAQPCISGIINAYSNISQFDCENSVYIDDPSFFKAGDLVLIYQTKGATLDNSLDSLQYGNVLSYNNAGKYEFNRIRKMVGNRVFLDSQMVNKYIVDPYLQFIRVPEYTDVKICPPGIRADVWDRKKGGVLALSVSGTLTMTSDIDVSSMGFKGGVRSLANSTFGVTTMHIPDLEFLVNSDKSAQKGEGIGTVNYISGRGKWANGGGGGNLHNGGGAGGANGGDGGYGGNGCELCFGFKELARGFGGIALQYSNTENRAFLGGGGGGGHRNGFSGSNGGDGGGLVIIRANEIIGNGRTIKANGANCNPSIDDGAGGAGAGGTVLLDANLITGIVTINVKGGNGGNIINNNDGPGGGGGGGVIWSKNPLPAAVVSQVNGGTPGIRLNIGNSYMALPGKNGLILDNLRIDESNQKYITPNLDFTAVSPTCPGDSNGVITFFNKGYKYSFQNQAFGNISTFSNLKGGKYSFSILYDTIKNCKFDTTITLINPLNTLKAAPFVSSEVVCNQKGAVQINPIGGAPPYSVSLNNGPSLPTSNFGSLDQGKYQIVLTDSKGCSTRDSFIIVDNSYKIAFSVQKVTDKSCRDTGSVIFNNPGTSKPYELFINSFPFQNLSNPLNPGNYKAFVVDSVGCKSDTLNFAIQDNFKFYRDTFNRQICNGGSFDFDGTLLTSSGNFTKNYLTKDGCDSTVTVLLAVNPVYEQRFKQEICRGKTVVLNNKTYSQSGVYRDTLQAKSGCDSVLVLELLVESVQSNVKITSNYAGVPISCAGKNDGAVAIAPTGGTSPYQIMWSTGSNSSQLSNLKPGSYRVSVTSASGCLQVDSVFLTEPAPITGTLATTPIRCKGERNAAITVNSMSGGNGQYFFSFEGSPYFEAPGFPWHYTQLFPGTYEILVKDGNGCEGTLTASIAEKPEFRIGLTVGDTTIRFGDSLQVAVTTSSLLKELIWSPKEYLTCDTCAVTTVVPIAEFIQITVKATDQDGCQDTASLTVFTKKDKNVFIPNIFSPQGMGDNITFKAFGSTDATLVKYFKVFDRWGNLLYTEQNVPIASMIGWDGTQNGQVLSPGIYVYVTEVVFADNTTQVYNGDVYLDR